MRALDGRLRVAVEGFDCHLVAGRCNDLTAMPYEPAACGTPAQMQGRNLPREVARRTRRLRYYLAK